MTGFCGCRTADKPRPVKTDNVGANMTSVILALTEDVPEISQRPFQFWMYRNIRDPAPVMASNRSAKALRYVVANQQVNIPVSAAAIHCMGTIFRAIEEANLKQSPEWMEFRRIWPYRFLELLPEVHDLYSYRSEAASETAEETPPLTWARPALWAGLSAAETPTPGEPGFRVRGYLQWKGVLLADGVTCVISRPEDVIRLLSDAVRCEQGNSSYCAIATEGDE